MLSASPCLAAPADYGVGDVVYRRELKEPLPNAFGGRDIWGRKRVIGTIEVRYRGLDRGAAVFSRRDTRLLTNETTVNRSDMVLGNVGDKNIALYGVGDGPTVQTLSPDETLVRVDMAADPVLLVDGHSLQVIQATPSRVRLEEGPWSANATAAPRPTDRPR